MPSKTATKVQYEVIRSIRDANEWRVEAIDYDRDGSIYVAIFTGPGAKERAHEYAAWKNS